MRRGEGPLTNWDVRRAVDEAVFHIDLVNGFPAVASPGECEVCDILWLIENGEGDEADNLFHLRDAWRERPEVTP